MKVLIWVFHSISRETYDAFSWDITLEATRKRAALVLSSVLSSSLSPFFFPTGVCEPFHMENGNKLNAVQTLKQNNEIDGPIKEECKYSIWMRDFANFIILPTPHYLF